CFSAKVKSIRFRPVCRKGRPEAMGPPDGLTRSLHLETQSRLFSTVSLAVSPALRVPSSIFSATASSTLLWMARRRGRAPYLGSKPSLASSATASSLASRWMPMVSIRAETVFSIRRATSRMSSSVRGRNT
ncbi:Septation protein SpoVG family protein, partial [Dysosmobacter welbionis]